MWKSQVVKIIINQKIPFKLYQSCDDGSRWNTMKILRGQRASLESSKGFYRDSKSYLNHGARFLNNHAQGFLEFNKNKTWVVKYVWNSSNYIEIDTKLKTHHKCDQILQGPEASLESSKSLYMSSRSYLNRGARFCQAVKHRCPRFPGHSIKLLKMFEFPWRIYENLKNIRVSGWNSRVVPGFQAPMPQDSWKCLKK